MKQAVVLKALRDVKQLVERYIAQLEGIQDDVELNIVMNRLYEDILIVIDSGQSAIYDDEVWSLHSFYGEGL